MKKFILPFIIVLFWGFQGFSQYKTLWGEQGPSSQEKKWISPIDSIYTYGTIATEQEVEKCVEAADKGGDLAARARLGVFMIISDEHELGLRLLDTIEKAYLHEEQFEKLSDKNKSFIRDSISCKRALFFLAYKVYLGEKVPQNLRNRDKGMTLLKKLAENNYPFSMTIIGEIYSNGLYGFPKNENEAYKWFMKGAKAGDAESQYLYGAMNYFGVVKARDLETARYWMNKSAKQGLPLAKDFLRQNAF